MDLFHSITYKPIKIEDIFNVKEKGKKKSPSLSP